MGVLWWKARRGAAMLEGLGIVRASAEGSAIGRFKMNAMFESPSEEEKVGERMRVMVMLGKVKEVTFEKVRRPDHSPLGKVLAFREH